MQVAAYRVLLTKALQPLKEHHEDCEKNIFNAKNFHRFYVHFLKFFSSQLNDQVDSVSPINTLLLHLINQGLSLITSNDQNYTDAEKTKIIIVFTETEFDTSPSTEFFPVHNLSTPHENLTNPENFSNASAFFPTHLFSLKHDAEVEFSSIRCDTLHVSDTQADYVSSYTATHPHQGPSRKLTKLFYDIIQPYSIVPHPHSRLSFKIKPANKSSAQYNIKQDIPNKKTKQGNNLGQKR